jgi:penicillin-binding protein
MYDLLTDTTRLSLSRDRFRARYVNALNAATATAVRTKLFSLLHKGPRAQAGFRAEWQTVLFGLLTFDNTVTLLWEGERWGVAWLPMLVLPQLGTDLKLSLLEEIPVRGHIYDRYGLGLAIDGQLVTIGLVPGWLQDEATTVAQVRPQDGFGPARLVCAHCRCETRSQRD